MQVLPNYNTKRGTLFKNHAMFCFRRTASRCLS